MWIGRDDWYGMGLMVDQTYGTQVVHHGGSMIGYKSDMMWLPEHGVGAVVLTNGDPGWAISGNFRRKLLEVLFDGKPEADNDLAAAAKAMKERSRPSASCSRSRPTRARSRSSARATRARLSARSP